MSHCLNQDFDCAWPDELCPCRCLGCVADKEGEHSSTLLDDMRENPEAYGMESK